MKDYIDYDEEVDLYEQEESEEEVLEEDVDEKNVIKRKKNKIESKIFNEDNFDKKVAKIISRIHRKTRADDKFSRWVEDNLSHLQIMYSLTNLSWTPVEFYTYVYENSTLN